MNRTIKNEDIRKDEKLMKLLEKGHVVLLDKVETSNPDFINLYLAQEVSGVGGSSVNEGQALLLKFDSTGKQIIRCVQNAHKEMADQINLGESLNEKFKVNFTLRVVDQEKPFYDAQTPRANRDGEALVSKENGNNVYRNAELTTVEDFEERGHKLIKAVSENEYQERPVEKSKIVGVTP